MILIDPPTLVIYIWSVNISELDMNDESSNDDVFVESSPETLTSRSQQADVEDRPSSFYEALCDQCQLKNVKFRSKHIPRLKSKCVKRLKQSGLWKPEYAPVNGPDWHFEVINDDVLQVVIGPHIPMQPYIDSLLTLTGCRRCNEDRSCCCIGGWQEHF